MNSNKRSIPPRGLPQPLRGHAGSTRQFKPVVAQLKTGVSAKSIKRPVAPAVYRPQAVPVVLQTKTAIVQRKAISQPRAPFHAQVIQRQLTDEDVEKVVAYILVEKKADPNGANAWSLPKLVAATGVSNYEASDNKKIQELYTAKVKAIKKEQADKAAAAAAAEAAKKLQEKQNAKFLADNFKPGKHALWIDLIERYRESKDYQVRAVDENCHPGTWGVCFEITRRGVFDPAQTMYTSYHVHDDGAHFKPEKKSGVAHVLKEKNAVSAPFTQKVKEHMKNKSGWVKFN